MRTNRSITVIQLPILVALFILHRNKNSNSSTVGENLCPSMGEFSNRFIEDLKLIYKLKNILNL